MLTHWIRQFWTKAGQRGQSSIEVLITMGMLAIAAQAVVVVVRVASKRNVSNRSQLIATEKAMEMLEELRSVVLDGSEQIQVLDTYDDGRLSPTGGTYTPVYKYTLTTRQDVTQPGGVAQADWTTGNNPLSGNPITGNGYAYVRTVEVDADTNSAGAVIDPNVRKIWVRIYNAAPNAGPNCTAGTNPLISNPAPAPVGQVLAEVFGMVHSLGTANQPTQVLDIYLLALESVPGWWSHTSDLIPLMNDAMVSLQSRNPGLQLRSHWIQTMSFGRDLEYTPETNQANRSDAAGAFDKTYVYPGQIQYNNGTAYNDQYYSITQFLGRINQDGTMVTNNNYAIADQFNHSLQEPDEERLYAAMVRVAQNNGVDPTTVQPSWRLVLDWMNSSNTSLFGNSDPISNQGGFPGFLNSILVNLHGEMVPVPPLRNYADGARDPDTFYFNRTNGAGLTLTARAWRAATHADHLANVSPTATLRVYAWDMNPPGDPIGNATEDDTINYITVFFPGLTVENNLTQVSRLRGNSRHSYKWMSGVTQSAGDTDPGSVNGNLITDSLSGTTYTATWWADDYKPSHGPALCRHSELRRQP
jgi:type II secretory pathway pseudopilin PulG